MYEQHTIINFCTGVKHTHRNISRQLNVSISDTRNVRVKRASVSLGQTVDAAYHFYVN